MLYFLLRCSALSPLYGVAAAEKQIRDVKEAPGSRRGWVTGEQGDERATMIVSVDGSYKAPTTSGSTTEGAFYLQDGKLRYRSSRTTGTASVAEDKGKTVFTVSPQDPNFRTGGPNTNASGSETSLCETLVGLRRFNECDRHWLGVNAGACGAGRGV